MTRTRIPPVARIRAGSATSQASSAPAILLAIFLVTLMAMAGCTSTGSAPEPTPAPQPPSRSVSQEASATPPPATTRGDPYHLDIPRQDDRDLDRWTASPKTGFTGSIIGKLRSGRAYRIIGACIYGYGDVLDYTVRDAREGKHGVLAKGSIDCDGAVHTSPLTVPITGQVQIDGDQPADKTVGYLVIRR